MLISDSTTVDFSFLTFCCTVTKRQGMQYMYYHERMLFSIQLPDELSKYHINDLLLFHLIPYITPVE